MFRFIFMLSLLDCKLLKINRFTVEPMFNGVPDNLVDEIEEIFLLHFLMLIFANAHLSHFLEIPSNGFSGSNGPKCQGFT